MAYNRHRPFGEMVRKFLVIFCVLLAASFGAEAQRSASRRGKAPITGSATLAKPTETDCKLDIDYCFNRYCFDKKTIENGMYSRCGEVPASTIAINVEDCLATRSVVRGLDLVPGCKQYTFDNVMKLLEGKPVAEAAIKRGSKDCQAVARALDAAKKCYGLMIAHDGSVDPTLEGRLAELCGRGAGGDEEMVSRFLHAGDYGDSNIGAQRDMLMTGQNTAKRENWRQVVDGVLAGYMEMSELACGAEDFKITRVNDYALDSRENLAMAEARAKADQVGRATANRIVDSWFRETDCLNSPLPEGGARWEYVKGGNPDCRVICDVGYEEQGSGACGKRKLAIEPSGWNFIGINTGEQFDNHIFDPKIPDGEGGTRGGFRLRPYVPEYDWDSSYSGGSEQGLGNVGPADLVSGSRPQGKDEPAERRGLVCMSGQIECRVGGIVEGCCDLGYKCMLNHEGHFSECKPEGGGGNNGGGQGDSSCTSAVPVGKKGHTSGKEICKLFFPNCTGSDVGAGRRSYSRETSRGPEFICFGDTSSSYDERYVIKILELAKTAFKLSRSFDCVGYNYTDGCEPGRTGGNTLTKWLLDNCKSYCGSGGGGSGGTSDCEKFATAAANTSVQKGPCDGGGCTKVQICDMVFKVGGMYDYTRGVLGNNKGYACFGSSTTSRLDSWYKWKNPQAITGFRAEIKAAFGSEPADITAATTYLRQECPKVQQGNLTSLEDFCKWDRIPNNDGAVALYSYVGKNYSAMWEGYKCHFPDSLRNSAAGNYFQHVYRSIETETNVQLRGSMLATMFGNIKSYVCGKSKCPAAKDPWCEQAGGSWFSRSGYPDECRCSDNRVIIKGETCKPAMCTMRAKASLDVNDLIDKVFVLSIEDTINKLALYGKQSCARYAEKHHNLKNLLTNFKDSRYSSTDTYYIDNYILPQAAAFIGNANEFYQCVCKDSAGGGSRGSSTPSPAWCTGANGTLGSPTEANLSSWISRINADGKDCLNSSEKAFVKNFYNCMTSTAENPKNCSGDFYRDVNALNAVETYIYKFYRCSCK